MKDRFSQRKITIGAIFVFVGLLYIGRLFYIQVIDSQYMLSAENNSRRFVVKYPARGLIYDRGGKLIVYNVAAYDLMVIPGQLEPFDSARLETILGISHKMLLKNLHKAKEYNYYRPSVFLKQISATSFAVLQEVLHRYPGFSVQPRTLRSYPYHSAGHLLGYVGEVDQKVLDKYPYYELGDYIGISGIEQTYEKELRGKKGGQYFNVDVKGRIKGRFKNGEYDTVGHVGKNLTTTLDIDLQNYGELLMKNKRGSIVAIEPSTGEILCLVSSPGYDPNILVGRDRTAKYWEMFNDTLKPLFNRALMAAYPPGSTFKPVNALVSLEGGIITDQTRFTCLGGYWAGPIAVECHPHESPIGLYHALAVSCNSYFINSFRNYIDNPKFGNSRLGYIAWRNYIDYFGFGHRLGIDLLNELPGKFPRAEYYDKIYGIRGWRSLTIFSLSIGQGEIILTPLQNANSAAIIANRGYYITPHVIKSIEGEKNIDGRYRVQHIVPIKKEYFEQVVAGMNLVVSKGTGGTASWCEIPGIPMCGKTGTAQNPHGDEHSIFIGFAPKDNPKIAISVYVENAGFGASWAAPIGSLMIEKYLTDTIKRWWHQKYILDTNLLHGSKPHKKHTK